MVKLTAKERIEKVVCWAGLNTSTFATHIGLSSPQTLYQIKSGKHDISRALAQRICSHYPDIEFGWLFAGEGEMIRPMEASIPHYMVDCTDVALGRAPAIPHSQTRIVGCGDCSFAAPYNSSAMEPDIKQGSTLFLKEVTIEEVQVGSIVLVATEQRATLRRVGEVTHAHITLVGPSGSPSPAITIQEQQIKRLYILKASLEWQYV